jgi:hypothetical protein
MESEVHGPSQIGEVDGTSADIRVGRERVESGEKSVCVCVWERVCGCVRKILRLRVRVRERE